MVRRCWRPACLSQGVSLLSNQMLGAFDLPDIFHFSDHLNLFQGRSNTFIGRWSFKVSDGGQGGLWMEMSWCIVCIPTLRFVWVKSFVISTRSAKCLPSQWTQKDHLCWFWLIDECVCACDWSCDSVCERKCGLHVLTWLSCCAAPGRRGRAIQVLECELPIELWKWELSREMGIAPCWFVTFAMLFGAFRVCIHHSFNQDVCVALVSLLLHYVLGSVFFSTCVSLIAYVGYCVFMTACHTHPWAPSPRTELN